MTTLREAQAKADRFWNGAGGAEMSRRAGYVAGLFPCSNDYRIEDLTMADGALYLSRLKSVSPPLSPATVTAYYQAFRRMLELSGKSTHDWPSPPTLPRKPREAISDEDFANVLVHLPSVTWTLATVLRHTGMRVDREALRRDWVYDDQERILRITGKGGHERVVPVSNDTAHKFLRDPGTWLAVTYGTHANNWRKAVEWAKVKSKLPTLHALRHSYATELKRNGADITTMQAMLGHASPATTGKYTQTTLADMQRALGAVPKAPVPRSPPSGEPYPPVPADGEPIRAWRGGKVGDDGRIERCNSDGSAVRFILEGREVDGPKVTRVLAELELAETEEALRFWKASSPMSEVTYKALQFRARELRALIATFS